jgi:hypothetical protein
VKHDDVYLHDYQTALELAQGLTRFFEFYDWQWPHSALDYHTPIVVELGKFEKVVLCPLGLAVTAAHFQVGANQVDQHRSPASGFATVYLAQQKSVQRLVALKVSSGTSHEGTVLCNLDHPHIVRVFDERVLPERKLRLLYMQYVAGGSLQTVIEQLRHVPRSWPGCACCFGCARESPTHA